MVSGLARSAEQMDDTFAFSLEWQVEATGAALQVSTAKSLPLLLLQ